ncbi:ankyrin repeat domain-containing protein [Thermodesulfobacteriota bacterium]
MVPAHGLPPWFLVFPLLALGVSLYILYLALRGVGKIAEQIRRGKVISLKWGAACLLPLAVADLVYCTYILNLVASDDPAAKSMALTKFLVSSTGLVVFPWIVLLIFYGIQSRMLGKITAGSEATVVAATRARTTRLALGSAGLSVLVVVATGAFLVAYDVDTRNGADWWPLELPCRNGDLEEVKYLLDNGADVNGSDREGRTPLMLAAYEGHLEIVKLLLDSGADVNDADAWGRTAFTLAVLAEKTEVAKSLLDNGADVNAADSRGDSALMMVSRAGLVDMAELLLKKGTKVDAVDEQGKTALMHAANYKQPQVAELLLKHGADAKARDNSGRSALWWLSQYSGSEPNVKKGEQVRAILLRHGTKD